MALQWLLIWNNDSLVDIIVGGSNPVAAGIYVQQPNHQFSMKH
jgi:hypothetical protein